MSEPGQKMLAFAILEILQQNTDAEHKLTQAEIQAILARNYEIKADRKTVRRNLLKLMETGYQIEYREAPRSFKNRFGENEDGTIMTDIYLEHDFADSELRLLVDSLLFSKHIPGRQRNALVAKLEGLSNKYFKSRIRYISALPDELPENRELFFTIEELDRAIEKKRKVAFRYNRYQTDKKLHPQKNEDGTVREYIVNPYQMAVANGKYYLICNYDKYDNISHYRLDRITGIRILDEPVKPLRNVIQGSLSLPKHMAEHIYMYSGESIQVSFRIKKSIIGDVIDWFGKKVYFFNETDDEVSVQTTVNETAMRRWALQYGVYATVLTPQRLADAVKEDIRKVAEQYGI